MIDKFYRWLSHRIQSRWRRQTTKLRTSQLKAVPAYYAVRSEWAKHDKARRKAAATVVVGYLVLALAFLIALGWSMR